MPFRPRPWVTSALQISIASPFCTPSFLSWSAMMLPTISLTKNTRLSVVENRCCTPPNWQTRALYQARFECIPLRRRNQERDGIQIPRAVHSERIAVDIVGNAVFPNSLPGDLPAAGKFFAAQRGHRTDERIPMRTKNARRGGHLVIDAVGLAIAGA